MVTFDIICQYVLIAKLLLCCNHLGNTNILTAFFQFSYDIQMMQVLETMVNNRDEFTCVFHNMAADSLK